MNCLRSRSCVACGFTGSDDDLCPSGFWHTCRYCGGDICDDCLLIHDCKSEAVDAAQASVDAANSNEVEGDV
jgi:hypothetical protein